LHAFITVWLVTGVRSEEARALTWEHVDLTAGTVSVWRSVRSRRDKDSAVAARTTKLPAAAVKALRAYEERQAKEHSDAGAFWKEHGLVFVTSVETPLESHNLRRDFRKVTKAAGIGERWVPSSLHGDKACATNSMSCAERADPGRRDSAAQSDKDARSCMLCR
jgi:integrase